MNKGLYMTTSLEKKVWVEICLHQHSIICRELYFAVMVENKVGQFISQNENVLLIHYFLLPQMFSTKDKTPLNCCSECLGKAIILNMIQRASPLRVLPL